MNQVYRILFDAGPSQDLKISAPHCFRKFYSDHLSLTFPATLFSIMYTPLPPLSSLELGSPPPPTSPLPPHPLPPPRFRFLCSVTSFITLQQFSSKFDEKLLEKIYRFAIYRGSWCCGREKNYGPGNKRGEGISLKGLGHEMEFKFVDKKQRFSVQRLYKKS